MVLLNRKILKLSIPAIVSNITVPLLGICDTAISGHLGSENYLAAIAVGSVMLNVVFWIFGFLRMGTTGLTANALGAGNHQELKRVFSRAIFIAFAAGFVMIIFQIPLMALLMKTVKTDTEISLLVADYFSLRIWGAPALLSTMAVTGWFVGMQNTTWPLIISVGMNVANIIFSFLMVFPLNFGFTGIAAGTLVANWIGLLISIVSVLWFCKGRNPFSSFREIFIRKGLYKFFNVNSNLFIRSFCIIAVTMGVTHYGARYGATALAVNVIIMQFFQFFSFFMDGFAFSGEALVGLYAGEQNFKMIQKSVRYLLGWTLGMIVIFTTVYFLFNDEITGLLTDNIEICHTVKLFEGFIIILPVISAWAFIFDGFYVGLTDTKSMMLSTLASSAFFFVIIEILQPTASYESDIFFNRYIWLGFFSYLALRGLILAGLWKQRLNHFEIRGKAFR